VIKSVNIVNSSASPIQQEPTFCPFGEERAITGGDSLFTGKERDSETGLDYFGARYYGSNMGRFMSPDEFPGGPVSAFGGRQLPPGPLPYADISNPQSLNKYAYAYNNPLRYIDPDGHEVADLCAQQKNCTQKTDNKGNTTVQLTNSNTKSVQNADGTTTVTTTTTTQTYTFNAAGNMTSGQQQVQVSNSTVSPTGATQWQTNTTTTPLSFGSAVGKFGAANLTSFQNSFLDPKGFWRTTGTELKNRPFKYGAAALSIGAGVTCLVAPCQEFTPGLISGGFATAAAGATVVDEVQNATKP
jgi:RHS repeat-associated protein